MPSVLIQRFKGFELWQEAIGFRLLGGVTPKTLTLDTNLIASAIGGSGCKIGGFTKNLTDAQGNQSFTGVGFQPSHIIFLSVVDTSQQVSIGFDDGTNHFGIANTGVLSANTWAVMSNVSIWMCQAATPLYYKGIIYSFDTDGFTIEWLKTGSTTGTAYVYYMAFK